MNWSKAKTILIICFFVGNLILGYAVWLEKSEATAGGEILPRDEIDARETLESKLGEHNLGLKVSLPQRTPRMYPLKLSDDLPDIDRLKDAMFASEADLQPVLVGGRLSGYRSSQAVMVVGSGGSVRFQRKRLPSAGERELTRQEAVRVAEDFMDDVRLCPAGLTLDYAERTAADEFLVFYCQNYRDHFIFGGGIMIRVERGYVREYQRLWYRVLGFTERARTVISAGRALLDNAERIGEIVGEEADIVDVSLGYYAGMQEAEKWTAQPVWRFRLKEGTVIFIDAFTGVLRWPL